MNVDDTMTPITRRFVVSSLVLAGATIACHVAQPPRNTTTELNCCRPECDRDCPINDDGGTGTKPHSATLLPHYVVMTLLYDPPGNMSEVRYGTGSSTGTKTSWANSLKTGVSIEGEVGDVDLSTEFGMKFGAGGSIEVTKDSSYTLGIQSQSDQMSHWSDTVYVWGNPQLNVTEEDTQDLTYSFGPRDQSPPNIVPLTAAEANNPKGIDPNKLARLPDMNDGDFENVRGLVDNLIWPDSGSFPKNDPRFTYRLTAQLDGPEKPTDPIPFVEFEVSNDATTATTATIETSLRIEAKAEVGFDFFGLFRNKVSAGVDLDIDHESEGEQATGHSEKAQVLLKTSTVGCHQSVDVYYDNVFRTFAFTTGNEYSDTPPCAAGAREHASMSGTVVGREGKPAANEVLTIVGADGRTRKVGTDAHGVFHVYKLPDGDTRISVRDHSESFRLRTPLRAARIIHL